MTTRGKTKGGCLCGNIRYECNDVPENVHFCHCGNPTSLSFRRGPGRGVNPSQSPHPPHLRSAPSPQGEGWTSAHHGSLDHPDLAPPTKYIYAADWLPWLHLDDGVERE